MELPDNALWPRLGVGYGLGCRQHHVDGHPKVTVYITQGWPEDVEGHRRHLDAVLRGEMPPDTIAHQTLDVGMYGTKANVLETMRMLKERAGL